MGVFGRGLLLSRDGMDNEVSFVSSYWPLEAVAFCHTGTLYSMAP